MVGEGFILFKLLETMLIEIYNILLLLTQNAKYIPRKIDNLEANNAPIRKKLEGGIKFKIKSNFQPAGDQPEAIKKILKNLKINRANKFLLGVTGSGKTFTMAKVIESANRPALVLAPNKTLAAQLYGEMKSFFPNNAVEYFVSYYDYYTPEAYVPRSDTYIEKEASINEQIDRMRHSATRSLLERDDVIIVASVSCIYGLGSVEAYSKMTLALKKIMSMKEMRSLKHLLIFNIKEMIKIFSGALLELEEKI